MRTLKADDRNKHHLLYPRADWSRGHAKKLRSRFSRKIRVKAHSGLHAEVMCIPVPPYPMLMKAWERYEKEQVNVDALDVLGAIEWLMRNIPDRKFREAMQKQHDYLYTHRCY